jgi:ribose transport system ATP-binding protein
VDQLHNVSSEPAASAAWLLRIVGLTKVFPGQVALEDVELHVRPGEVHSLLGQNGSGKSTLVKVLAGYHKPTSFRTAEIGGKSFELGDSSAARTNGICTVHQDLGLVGSISSVENLAMGPGYKTGRGFRIRWRDEERRAQEALREVGFEFDVRRPVQELSASERTGVAIARAIRDANTQGRLLVLDEPTSALPVEEVDRLFTAMRQLRDRGLSILFISHHLEEVFKVADRVTVLRDGRNVLTCETRELDRDSLAELIVGHRVNLQHSFPAEVPSSAPTPILSARSLAGKGVIDLDLDVGPGEVVGVTGLTGSGAEDLAGLLAGKTPRLGRVTIDGVTVKSGDPRGAVSAGMAFVPGDRARDGLMSKMTVRENLTVGRLSAHMRGPYLSIRSERSETKEWIERLGIVTSGPDVIVGTLSGGNQQKVVLGRALRLRPRVLVLDDPTKGVDVGAKEEFHILVDDVAARGGAVLLTSSDVTELQRLCTRVLVLQAGRIASTFNAAEMTVEDLEHAILGRSVAGTMTNNDNV